MTKTDVIKDLQVLYQNKPNRLNHVFGVRDTALELGRRHDADLDKLEWAALLHDITKYYPKKQNMQLIRSYFADAEDIIANYNEHILHAYSAVVVASREYGIADQDVLNAICHHTIGKPAMSIYEKIIFISDYIEPNRTYESCVKVRAIAFVDLDLAVYTAIDDSIRFYETTGGQVPKTAYLARDYYKPHGEDTA